MTDLSYTNKDGLNLYDGFDNGFDYHRDAASSGQGYANGGYPEITDETSDLPNTNYKTGDDPDFFHNGNIWVQPSVGPGPGPGPVAKSITLNGVYKRCALGSISGTIDDWDTVSISYGDYSVEVDAVSYEWNGVKFLGNTNILTAWGYDGEPMHTDWKFCLVKGYCLYAFILDEYYVDEQALWVSFKIGTYSNTPIQHAPNKYASFNGTYNEVGDYGYDASLIGQALSSEDAQILTDHNGYGVNVTCDGEKYVATIEAEHFVEDEKDYGWEINFDGITNYYVNASNWDNEKDELKEQFGIYSLFTEDYIGTLTDLTVNSSIVIDI